MDFTLRDFQPSDFETLWRIDQQCFVSGIAYSQPELKAYVQLLGGFTLIADETPPKLEQLPSSTIMGFLVAHRNRRGLGHIITIDVVPEARRVGVGSALLQAAEERLRGAQCHSVVLETAVDNQGAVAFYKRHEYFLVKTVPRYYSNGVDALVLQKDLLSSTHAS